LSFLTLNLRRLSTHGPVLSHDLAHIFVIPLLLHRFWLVAQSHFFFFFLPSINFRGLSTLHALSSVVGAGVGCAVTRTGAEVGCAVTRTGAEVGSGGARTGAEVGSGGARTGAEVGSDGARTGAGVVGRDGRFGLVGRFGFLLGLVG